jgi:hypothetical protein
MQQTAVKSFLTMLAFFCFGFFPEINAQNRSLQVSKIVLPEDKIKYKFEPDGISYSINPNWDNNRKMLRMQHSAEKDYVHYDEYFNRAIKRGTTILATGDKPRFAVLYSAFQSRVDPDLIKMGDGRIRIIIEKDSFFLDELSPGKVIFQPSATSYIFSNNRIQGLEIQLLVSQAAAWGAVAKLQLTNKTGQTIRIHTELVYGGLRTCGRTFSASYFSPVEKENIQSNQVNLSEGEATITDKKFQGSLTILSNPVSRPFFQNKRTVFPFSSDIGAGKSESIFFTIGLFFKEDRSSLALIHADPEFLIRESKMYYERILARYQIHTPSELMNNAFKSALLNFDNIYAGKAWLEGIHWWSAYWTNNFQISAAIGLGEFNKAGKALDFYNSSAYGPCPILKADGTPDAQSKNGEDGLPYYIYNLIAYYESTGDRSLLERVWPSLRKSIDLLWKMRDKDGNGLINWHMGANAFLYQADHLEMPGDAASPSIMMGAMLAKLSFIAGQIGQSKDSEQWKSLSQKITENLPLVLWNKSEGAFFNHRDEQGLAHKAHYYTDLVYPALYSNMPDLYGWQSMDYLTRFLWTDNYKGERSLMRVGEFRPSIFGNDNVMPVQMAEAARAYFKLGENKKGLSLMESVALAATIFTEAPGNFPERMNDEGKGEANYLFGNPIGSFLYTCVNGLFGLQLKDKGKTISCEPAFPEHWYKASIKLPFATFSFTKSGDEVNKTCTYDIVQYENRKTDFSVFLEAGKRIKVFSNGKPVEFETTAGLNKTRISFHLPAALKQQITIQYSVADVLQDADLLLKPGEEFHWKGNQEIEKIADPQSALSSFQIKDNTIGGVAGPDTGWHVIYIWAKQSRTVEKLRIHTTSSVTPPPTGYLKRSFLKEEKVIPLDISPRFNTDSFFLASRWRYEYELRDSAYFALMPDNSRKIFEWYGYPFQSGNSMAVICRGISDGFTTETKKVEWPDSMEFAVGRKVKMLTFLWACETQARNTGMEVGYITLTYRDGSQKQIQLKVGDNLDASWKYFATQTEPVLLHGEDYAKTYGISCDPGKELKSFSIRLVAADVLIGLLGVNMVLPERLPLVGAIRWDGWFYDTSNSVTKILQKTLAPKEFHDRLPFFAKEISNDSVYVNGSAQEVMDEEIKYAKAGGLDYWAFVLYSPGEGLSVGMKNYLKSPYRKDIHFSIITEQGRVIPSEIEYLNYIRQMLEEPDFQLVENNRPLWFLGFIDSASVVKNWGGFGAMKKTLDSIRLLITQSGRNNPYLVIMDFNATLGKRWADSLGADAISSYVAQKNSIRAPYQKLTEEAELFWNECKATGAEVIPICDAGWSPKPRMDYKNEWTHFYPPGNYYANATPIELANHIRRGMSWLEKNKKAAPAQALLIYAWNEYDEGGWLGPTLFEGSKRLDALSVAIMEYKQKRDK